MGFQLLSHANTLFCFKTFTSLMTTLVKTIYGILYKGKNLLNYVLECFGKFKLEN